LRSYLEEKVAAPVKKTDNMAVGDPLCDTPLSAKVGTNFADKRCHSVGIVHSWLESTEFLVFFKPVECQPAFLGYISIFRVKEQA
jgi:hypothetical protein